METSPASRAVLDAGSEVGDLAMELYGPGLLIGHVEKTSMALAETAAALQGKGKRQTLFEAAFQHKDVLIRADVLKPVAGGYDLIEVKSSTSVKDYHLIDCAIQAWVIRNAGIPLRRVYLAHIDPAFVYEGDGNYNGLLAAEDVTDTLAELMEQVPAWVRRLQKILRGDEPSIATGEQCSKPFECPSSNTAVRKSPRDPSTRSRSSRDPPRSSARFSTRSPCPSRLSWRPSCWRRRKLPRRRCHHARAMPARTARRHVGFRPACGWGH
jgi:hypothetical protein